MRQYTIEKADEGQTVLKYLQRILPLAPTGFFYKMFRKKNIVLNDNKKLTGKEKIMSGDKLKLFLSDDTIVNFSQNIIVDTSEYLKAFEKYGSPEVVYEDEHLLFINKPIGVLSQKSKPYDLSANEWMIGYLLNKKEINEHSLTNFKPSICNRLDRNTGGILIFAKSLFGANTINPLIKDRSLHKYYLTLVHGNIKEEIHDVSYLIKDNDKNIVSVSKEPLDGYSRIETFFYPIKYNSDKNITLVNILLVTGKTHQIRSTLNYLGYPIVGDGKYNSLKAANEDFGLRSQVLYAYKLEFPAMDNYEALSGKNLEIKTPKTIERLMK